MIQRRAHTQRRDKEHKHDVFSGGPVDEWENPPHGQQCRCEPCRVVMRRNLAMWRRRTGATSPTTAYKPQSERAPEGSRSCYVRCVKREEGPHDACAAANREYQANYAFARRHDLTMDEAAIIREHLSEMPRRNLLSA